MSSIMTTATRQTRQSRPLGNEAFTSERIESELSTLESQLRENERQQLLWEVSEEERDAQQEHLSGGDMVSRLQRLEKTAEDLALARGVSMLVEQEMEDTQVHDDEGRQLLMDCRRCWSLGILLGQHQRARASSFFRQLYEDEFLSLYDYTRKELLFKLRNQLRQANYPEESSNLLQQSDESFRNVAWFCKWIVLLEEVHLQLQCLMPKPQGGHGKQRMGVDAIVMEFCRPFVERIHFHFLEPNDSRLSSSRIDRLPELLFGYLREHVFASEGPWDLVVELMEAWEENTEVLVPHGNNSPPVDSAQQHLNNVPLHFLNELIRIVQWVLGERNFFRHPKVVGSDSNPMLLSNAIHQILLFDYHLQSLVRDSYPTRDPNNQMKILSLTDIFVTGDDDLLQWWLQRERECAFSRLSSDDVPTEALVNRVSPRAELFSALMVSIQAKAGIVTFSGPYMNHVAAPLCMQFVDAIDETTAELKEQLKQRKLPSDEQLDRVINKWVELTNGTHMAARIISNGFDLSDYDNSSHSADHDMIRFGRSLQSLQQVLVDEFVVAFVETVLMERTKFAVYLMRCPSLLCDELGVDDHNNQHHLSPELRETVRVLKRFLRLCEDLTDIDESPEIKETAQFAPRLMREGVLTLLTEKLVDIAMNQQGMTPNLLARGSAVFAQDVRSLFGTFMVPAASLRLLDISRFMSMPSSQLVEIGQALCGLAGLPAPLPEDAFLSDERLFQEATSMLRAKGLAWIEVEDVISILNRRRDL